jgi:hypothetical protein
MDAVPKRFPLQRVKVEPGDVRVDQRRRVMEDVKPPPTSLDESWWDLPRDSSFENLLQALVAEAPNHGPMCNLRCYYLSSGTLHTAWWQRFRSHLALCAMRPVDAEDEENESLTAQATEGTSSAPRVIEHPTF